MKRIKSIYGLLAAGALLFASCNINEEPTFDDKDAFVAFTNATMSIGEEKGTLEIPVLLTSLSGISTTVDFEVVADASTAVEGTHYNIEGGKSLPFTKDAPMQYIKLEIINDDVFTNPGYQTITFSLKTPQGVNLGANKTCQVTIQDDEHPLLFILGTYAASAKSYFSSRGSFDWDITIERDADDLNKVWIGNLEPYFAANGFVAPSKNYFYGTVNEEKTEIRVPVGQKIGYSDNGVDVVLAGFTGPDPDESEELSSGKNMTITILENGAKLRIENAYGAASDGWWNLMYGNQTITKK